MTYLTVCAALLLARVVLAGDNRPDPAVEEKAVAVLKEAIVSRAPLGPGAAVLALSDLPDCADRSAVVRTALSSSRDEVRALAIRLSTPQEIAGMLPKLFESWRANPQLFLRAAILEAFGKIEDPQAIQMLQDTALGQEGLLTGVAFAALEQMGRRGAAILANVLASGSDEQRETAAWAMGRNADETVVPALRRALKDPSAKVRYAASAGLHAHRQDVSLSELRGICEALIDQDRKLDCNLDRYRLGDKGAASAIKADFSTGSETLRTSALDKSKNLADVLDGTGLKHALTDPSVYVRLAALRVIAARGEPSSYPGVEGALSDKSEQVRLAAATILASAGGPQARNAALNVLRKGLESPISGTRMVALGGIAKQGGEQAATLLRPYLHDPDPAVVTEAIDGLALLDDRSAVREISRLLTNEQSSVGWAAAKALSRLDPKSALASYTSAMQSQAPGAEVIGAGGIVLLACLSP